MLLADWKAPAYDPAESRRLLKEAGYKGEPIPYQMLNNYYTTQLQTAQIMVESWKARRPQRRCSHRFLCCSWLRLVPQDIPPFGDCPP